ncbi:MAG: hypothetical protein ACKVX9_15980 [Blastocatellia bacterium]
MNSAKKIMAILFWMALCVPAALAQRHSTGAAATDVTIIIQQEKIRFTARSPVAELRLQVFDQAGELVYDSGSVLEPTLDWTLQNGGGQAVRSGLYAYSLLVREYGAEPGAEPPRPRRGHFIVDRASEQDGRTDRLWVTSRNDGGVGAELTVIRDEAATVAGAAMSSTGSERTIGPRAGNSGRDAAGRSIEAEPAGRKMADPAAAAAAPAGTVGQIARFTSATEVGNSVITEAGGNIGIGTTTPTSGIKLEVNGAALLTPGGKGGSIQFGTPNTETGMSIVGAARADLRFDGSTVKLVAGPAGGPPGSENGITVNTSGVVGIGTTNQRAGYKLEVNGATAITPGGSGGEIFFGTPNAETGMSIVGSRRADIRFDGSALKFAVGPLGGPPDPRNGIAINASGNIGIGTAAPATKLHVENAGITELAVRSLNERAILSLGNTIGPANYVWTMESGVRGQAGLFGIYNRTVNRSGLEIDGNLMVYVKALQITGGADLAENFDVRAEAPDSGASVPEVQPGMIVAIDPASPGKLNLSRRAYDRRVAGIISGAGDVKPGMMMGQAGTLADGKHPVALSGRVYAWVDATRGAIRPGDLLTSSPTPGHAMKATNPARARGAIIGKAMTGLASGKGLVLVLVTLQ